MANWYVWSAAAGAGTGADWTNAYTTLGAAATAKAAGDTFFVAHDHAETAASAKTITFAGTDALPNRVYCVNRAGSVPPVSADLRATATISTTGAFSISIVSAVDIYGIIFSAGDATNAASISLGSTATGRTQRFNSCSLRLGNTSSSSRLNNPATGSCFVILENTTLQFGSTNQMMTISGRMIWRNTATALLGAVFPTTFISQLPTANPSILFEGIDLSALASGKTLINPTGGPSSNAVMTIKDCKLGASVTVSAAPPNVNAGDIVLIRCDSGDTNYRTERYSYMGTMTTETTIVRTGGATDGTTPIAWKIVTTANSEWEFPFECLPISAWNETTGSAITVTIQGIWGGGAVPRNDDIWIDCEYLGTSGFPLASKATSNKADGLAADAALSAGAGTWGGSTIKFAMSATFTPAEKGPLTIYVRAALPSSTFYIDPKPVIT